MKQVVDRMRAAGGRSGAIASRWSCAIGAAFVACMVLAAPCKAQTPAVAPQHLRIVGGLAALNQYTRHEEPFWSRELARLSDGRATAEIVPFDRAGIRAQEMLRLVQLEDEWPDIQTFGTFF